VLLSQGRFWRAELAKDGASVTLAPLREALGEGESGLKEVRFQVPLGRWNAVVKHAQSDRKLLGGLLLDFASRKEPVATAVSRDRLWIELVRVVLEATATLVAAGHLVLCPPESVAP